MLPVAVGRKPHHTKVQGLKVDMVRAKCPDGDGTLERLLQRKSCALLKLRAAFRLAFACSKQPTQRSIPARERSKRGPKSCFLLSCRLEQELGAQVLSYQFVKPRSGGKTQAPFSIRKANISATFIALLCAKAALLGVLQP